MKKIFLSGYFISRLNKKSGDLYKYQKCFISQLKDISDRVFLIYTGTQKPVGQLDDISYCNFEEFLSFVKTLCAEDEVILAKDCFFGLFCNYGKIISAQRKSGKKIFTIYNDSNFLMTRGKYLSDRFILDFYNNKLILSPQEVASLLSVTKDSLSPIYDLYELVKDYGLPYIETKCVFLQTTDAVNFNLCDEFNKTIQYLHTARLYDVRLIYEFILDNINVYDIKNLLNLNYVIDKDLPVPYEKNKRTALFVYLFYDDLFDECINYIKNVPKHIDIYIATDSEQKVKRLKHLTNSIKNNLNVIKTNARGRDIAVFVTVFAKYLKTYEYACFLHDKKSSYMGYTVGKNFRKLLWDNMMISENYIKHILKIFDEEDHIGLLVPPNVYHGKYFSSYCCYWGENYKNTEQCMKQIDDKVPLACDKDPVAVGSVFWFKTKALLPITKLNLKNEDFPPEPFPNDGSKAHAVERLFPYIAQSAGYFTATIYNNQYAAAEISNFRALFKDYILSTKTFDGTLFDYSKIKGDIK